MDSKGKKCFKKINISSLFCSQVWFNPDQIISQKRWHGRQTPKPGTWSSGCFSGKDSFQNPTIAGGQWSNQLESFPHILVKSLLRSLHHCLIAPLMTDESGDSNIWLLTKDCLIPDVHGD